MMAHVDPSASVLGYIKSPGRTLVNFGCSDIVGHNGPTIIMGNKEHRCERDIPGIFFSSLEGSLHSSDPAD